VTTEVDATGQSGHLTKTWWNSVKEKFLAVRVEARIRIWNTNGAVKLTGQV